MRKDCGVTMDCHRRPIEGLSTGKIVIVPMQGLVLGCGLSGSQVDSLCVMVGRCFGILSHHIITIVQGSSRCWNRELSVLVMSRCGCGAVRCD